MKRTKKTRKYMYRLETLGLSTNLRNVSTEILRIVTIIRTFQNRKSST